MVILGIKKFFLLNKTDKIKKIEGRNLKKNRMF